MNLVSSNCYCLTTSVAAITRFLHFAQLLLPQPFLPRRILSGAVTQFSNTLCHLREHILSFQRPRINRNPQGSTWPELWRSQPRPFPCDVRKRSSCLRRTVANSKE